MLGAGALGAPSLGCLSRRDFLRPRSLGLSLSPTTRGRTALLRAGSIRLDTSYFFPPHKGEGTLSLHTTAFSGWADNKCDHTRQDPGSGGLQEVRAP